MKRFISVAGLLLAASPMTQADNFFSDVSTTSHETNNVERDWQVGGYVQQRISLGNAKPDAPLHRTTADATRLESTLNLFGEWQALEWVNFRLAADLTHDWLPALEESLSYTFSDEDIQSREWQMTWQDSYADADLGVGWLRAGQQTIAWGESESAVITDVLSPRNNRWPGQANLDDIRLPIPSVKLDLPIGNSQLTAITTFQAGADKIAPAGGEFDQYIALRPMNITITNDAPETDFEFALAWQTTLSGSDMTLILADVNSNQLHLADVTPVLSNGSPVMINGQPIIDKLTTAQDRYQMIGFTANKAMGRWLLRTEAAYKYGRVVMPEPKALFSPWPEYNSLQAMAGFEVNAFSGWTLSAELNAERIESTDDVSFGWGSRLSWAGLNDRLTVQTLIAALPDEALQLEHGLMRYSASWNISDGWNAEVTGTLYFAREQSQALYAFRNNDTVSVQLRGSF